MDISDLNIRKKSSARKGDHHITRFLYSLNHKDPFDLFHFSALLKELNMEEAKKYTIQFDFNCMTPLMFLDTSDCLDKIKQYLTYLKKSGFNINEKIKKKHLFEFLIHYAQDEPVYNDPSYYKTEQKELQRSLLIEITTALDINLNMFVNTKNETLGMIISYYKSSMFADLFFLGKIDSKIYNKQNENAFFYFARSPYIYNLFEKINNQKASENELKIVSLLMERLIDSNKQKHTILELLIAHGKKSILNYFSDPFLQNKIVEQEENITYFLLNHSSGDFIKSLEFLNKSGVNLRKYTKAIYQTAEKRNYWDDTYYTYSYPNQPVLNLQKIEGFIGQLPYNEFFTDFLKFEKQNKAYFMPYIYSGLDFLKFENVFEQSSDKKQSRKEYIEQVHELNHQIEAFYFSQQTINSRSKKINTL